LIHEKLQQNLTLNLFLRSLRKKASPIHFLLFLFFTECFSFCHLRVHTGAT
jgi:hypothetical protein